MFYWTFNLSKKRYVLFYFVKYPLILNYFFLNQVSKWHQQQYQSISKVYYILALNLAVTNISSLLLLLFFKCIYVCKYHYHYFVNACSFSRHYKIPPIEFRLLMNLTRIFYNLMRNYQNKSFHYRNINWIKHNSNN